MSTSNEETTHFGDAFEAFFKRRDITLAALNRRSGVNYETLKRWKEGETKNPHKWEEIIRVAAALDLNQLETDLLLRLAGHPSIEECQALSADDLVTQAINEILLRLAGPLALHSKVSVQFEPPLERPRLVEYFQGRDKELAQLLDDLKPGRVVALCGPGGIGKTALAAAAIWQLAPNRTPPDLFPDGIIYHNFYQRPQVELALEHIAHSFGEEIKRSPKEAAQRALSGRCALLLLDGTEQADDIRPILDIQNQCCVLITSRSRRDALSIRQDIQPLPIQNSIALLQAWGGKRTTDIDAVQRISELVGFLPLALRLVGRYLSQTDEEASEYVIWLEKTPLAKLDQGNRQEESVPLLLDRSVARLGTQAKEILGVVGIHSPSPFT